MLKLNLDKNFDDLLQEEQKEGWGGQLLFVQNLQEEYRIIEVEKGNDRYEYYDSGTGEEVHRQSILYWTLLPNPKDIKFSTAMLTFFELENKVTDCSAMILADFGDGCYDVVECYLDRLSLYMRTPYEQISCLSFERWELVEVTVPDFFDSSTFTR